LAPAAPDPLLNTPLALLGALVLRLFHPTAVLPQTKSIKFFEAATAQLAAWPTKLGN